MGLRWLKGFMVLFVFALVASGCSNTLKVTFHSDPPGGILYLGSQQVGYTPQTLTYQLSESDLQRGYTNLDTAIRWVSGVERQGTLKVNFNEGFSQQFIARRPNLPGRDIDEEFAIRVQEFGAMQRAQQAAALSRALGGMAYAIAPNSPGGRMGALAAGIPLPPEEPVRQPVHCNLVPVGNGVLAGNCQ